VLENRELRTPFEFQGKKIAEDWRKLHNVKLHYLYCIKYYYNIKIKDYERDQA
jgi:hypothetical protein